MSRGSKPEQTIGLCSSRAIHSYGRQPITVETCPGPINASMRMSGESRIARMAGMMVTWLQKTEKFRRPSARARMSVRAVEGAVVSKPMAKNMTCLSGFLRASLQSVGGGIDDSHHPPRAPCIREGVPFAPGTRIKSPKAVKMTSGCRHMERPSSILPMGKTQTGHPGP